MGLSFTFRSILLGVPVGYIFFNQVGCIVRVEGSSMQPTLNPDLEKIDWVFLNRWAVRDRSISRGDIVAFKSPKYPYQKLIKRVIGLSGDVIYTLGYRKEILEVPEKQCWVEGDHTGKSLDSNTFGPIPLEIITEKATHIVWPPSRWQSLENNIPDNRIPINYSHAIAA
ncbi:mitochondrial inner membrane protease subunit 2-like [Phymastichus coffea]|uniref:mitochondrial inner membrane protease subunit 2-like n=1 Tax=Phymastichus coffea TaxID=108790 RepID=UPI00273AA7F8|nr:mitochondrial inner membrane protease subunit 2-like [Phymastichus coffea]